MADHAAHLMRFRVELYAAAQLMKGEDLEGLRTLIGEIAQLLLAPVAEPPHRFAYPGDGWEPLDADRSPMWGLFCQEGYSADPLALFSSEADADRYLKWQTEELPEDERLAGDFYCVLTVRQLQGVVWNSCDPAPGHAPTLDEVEAHLG